MKKLSIWFFVIFGALALRAEAAPPPNEMEQILRRGKLIVAILGEDVEPLFFHDAQGQLQGFDVELARDIAARLGVNLEFNRKAKTYDRVVELVAEGEADVAISMISSTLKRAVKVRFSDTYLTLHRALIINRLALSRLGKEDSNINEVLNEKNVRIGVVAHCAYVDFVREDFPKAEVVPIDNWDALAEGVIEGKVLAAYYDDVQIKMWLRAHPENALYAQSVVRYEAVDPLAWAVRWESNQLIAWLNLYLQKIKQEGKYDELMRKYLKDIQQQPKPDANGPH
ncbi:MAG: ABC transporter substrate-binding protein [bacterium]|nr:ABC transporter substrate-binding protein [bacterium]